jgi:hemerythrin-like domain-containing protein
MIVTEILRNEHRIIEQVLNCLEKIAGRCTAEGDLDAGSATSALDFFRNFADRCHHGKEEGRLFPLLEERGLPRNGGPTGVMRAEHEQGRLLLQGMADAVGAAENRDAAAPGRFAACARSYVELMRSHIRKEDERLFPMADRVLSPTDQESLQEAFGAMEHEEMGEGTHESFLRLANELADRWNVPRARLETAAPACGSCGCHGH